MDTKELIEQGDSLWFRGNYKEAFNYYHQAHMQNDPNGTYKLADCFRFAFHQRNLDNIDYSKCREYARKAIDLYGISYKRFGCEYNLHRDESWYMEQVSQDYLTTNTECDHDKDWYKQRFRDTILLKRLFVKRLINDLTFDLPEETLMMKKFQENENEYLNFLYNAYAMFLSADIHRKVAFLVRLCYDDYSVDIDMRIAAIVRAFIYCCSAVICESEACNIVGCLSVANTFGATFDIPQMYNKLKVVKGIRNPARPGIWKDVDPKVWAVYEEIVDKWFEIDLDEIGDFSDNEECYYDEDEGCYDEEACYDDESFYSTLDGLL